MRLDPLSILICILISLICLAACGSNANAEPTPPTIHYGEDMCHMCGMIISDERFAAAYITRAGENFIFDDTGDMVQYHLQNQTNVAAFFVHDHQDKSWIRAETAFFVLSDDITTPMGSGIAALASKEQAQALANEVSGQMMTFDQVLAHYRQNGAPNHTGESQEEHSSH